MLMKLVWGFALLFSAVCAQSSALRTTEGLPKEGDVYQAVVKISSSMKIVLPPGEWEVNHVFDEPQPANRKAFVFINKVRQAPFKVFIARYELMPRRWGVSDCENKPSNSFGQSLHGTASNQLKINCSQIYSIAKLRYNVKERWKENTFWGPIFSKFKESAIEALPEDALLMESSSSQFNGLRIFTSLFFETSPLGESGQVFRSNLEAKKETPLNTSLLNWRDKYVASLDKAFFDGNEPVKDRLAFSAPTGNPAAAEILQELASATEKAKRAEQQQALDKTKKKGGADQEQKQKESQELAKLMAEMAKLREQLLVAQTQPKVTVALAEVAVKKTVFQAPSRRALVIGNDSYQEVNKLQNARADAKAMGLALQKVGFTVTSKSDLTERGMKDAIRTFKSEIRGGDEVVIFFAGHGVQLGSSNFLLPIDIRGQSEDQVKDEAMPLQRMLDDIQDSKAKFALAIIDACRDNPFKSTGRAIGGRGLAPTSAASGQMVIFSAGTGQQALDRLNDKDTDPNGLFTRIFLKEMDKPGVSIDRVLRSVRTEVVRLSKSVGHEQVPSLYDQALGDFYFKP